MGKRGEGEAARRVHGEDRGGRLRARARAVVNAAKSCAEELAADPAAFREDYGTGHTLANAIGKCVAAKASGSGKEDDEDAEPAEDEEPAEGEPGDDEPGDDEEGEHEDDEPEHEDGEDASSRAGAIRARGSIDRRRPAAPSVVPAGRGGEIGCGRLHWGT